MHHNELSELFKKFNEPWDIQQFLNPLEYSPDYGCRSPLNVARDRIAHCSEAAFFAAAALKNMGYKPLIVILYAKNDDDHLLAVFKKNGLWGSIAKSNTTMLRYREPVYRTIRELVMSYFDLYFNIKRMKSLRKYSKPINMDNFAKYNWIYAKNLDFIWEQLKDIRKYDLLDGRAIKQLKPADNDLMDACFAGSDAKGLFKPK